MLVNEYIVQSNIDFIIAHKTECECFCAAAKHSQNGRCKMQSIELKKSKQIERF